MKGIERRKKLVDMLHSQSKPISGDALAAELGVSRQVIVQDIALLRANGLEIISTNRGYYLNKSAKYRRVFKVRHTDTEAEEEMNLIIDLGGRLLDVFVYHRVYGVIKTEMNLRSRWDIQNYLRELTGGKSSFLLNITSGYHYHTVEADSEEILALIKDKLRERGFLAELTDYEPVEF